jgi:serine protease Do
LKTRAKWIAVLIVLSMASALVASLLTAVFLVRGLIGSRSSRWIALLAGQADATAQTGPASGQTGTSGTTALPDLTPIPTATHAPSPTPSPTPKPTPSPLPTAVPTPTPPVQNAAETLYLWQTRQLVQRIYDEIAPSVVGIYVEVPASGNQSARTNEASGLIIDKTGTLVTDSAVLSVALNKQGKLVAGTRIDILVRGTERIFSAAYIGRDPITGLAVLDIDGGETTFSAPDFADSLDLKVGQMVLAIGYPDLMIESGGLSSGFISAISRMVMLESGTSVQMIQTDLQISSLCAGGPVLNLDGKVIGLSSCGLAKDPFDLKTYALPVDSMLAVAKGILDQKAETGRAWLGITVLSASSFQELQRLYRFPDGLYISSVIQDSPAYVADLRKSDIIIQINDEPVFPSTDLSSFLKEQPVGAAVKIRIFRRTENKTLDILVYLQESLR